MIATSALHHAQTLRARVASETAAVLMAGMIVPLVLVTTATSGQPSTPSVSSACQWAKSNLSGLDATLPEMPAAVAPTASTHVQSMIAWASSGCPLVSATRVEAGLLAFYAASITTTGQPPTGTILAGLQVITTGDGRD